MTNIDDEDLENSYKYRICDNAYVNGGNEVRDHCHIPEKCRGSVQRDCNMNVKLNL